MAVFLHIQDSSGTEIGSFQAEDQKSLAEMAALHGIEIFQSCSTGFCGVCLCEILEGAETVQLDKTGDPLFELARDDTGNPKQILTCIGGIKSEMFVDGKDHMLLIKKAY